MASLPTMCVFFVQLVYPLKYKRMSKRKSSELCRFVFNFRLCMYKTMKQICVIQCRCQTRRKEVISLYSRDMSDHVNLVISLNEKISCSKMVVEAVKANKLACDLISVSVQAFSFPFRLLFHSPQLPTFCSNSRLRGLKESFSAIFHKKRHC